MKAITTPINTWVDYIGKGLSWVNLALILLICVDVTLRYLFSTTKVWVIDLEWHMFALIFLLGASYTLKADKHVRVDVFYDRWSDRTKAIIDLMGHVLFLIPWCLVVIYTSYRYAINSWTYREGAADPGGLPMRYIIKFAIVVGFVMLLLQAIVSVFDKISQVKNSTTWKK